MHLPLFLLLLAPVTLAQGWHGLEVNGRVICPPHITLDIWSFEVSLARQRKYASGKLEVVDAKRVMEGSRFSLKSPYIVPWRPVVYYDYFLKIDGPKLCFGLPKSIPLDARKRNIDLGVVDVSMIH